MHASPPVSFQVDAARGRVELAPELAYRRGVYDVVAQFDVERLGGARGVASAASVLHPGDFLKTNFDVGLHDAFRIDADASEAQGGALAGTLGLAANQPFQLAIHAKGTVAQGDFTLFTRVGTTDFLGGSGAWNK